MTPPNSVRGPGDLITLEEFVAQMQAELDDFNAIHEEDRKTFHQWFEDFEDDVFAPEGL